jgi:predicted dehydrogenase
MSKLNIGIIGAGGIANKLHLPQLKEINDVNIVVVSGRKEHRLKILCDRFDIPRWTQNYEEVLADDSLDGIVVATPHPLHVGPGIKAMASGKHLMMQKPLCGDMDEANAFVDAADRSESIVFCLPHFAPEIYAMRELAARGDIGQISGAYARTSHGGPEVYYAEVLDAFEEKSDELWFFDAKQASVGALFDMGVYAVSCLVAMMGTVKNVIGRVKTIAKPTELEDVATLILEFENGALGTAETSWCDPARTGQMRIHGTAGKLTTPGEDGASLSKWTPGSYTREDIPPTHEPVNLTPYQAGHGHAMWVDCIRKGENPELSNAHSARHVTEVLLAGLKSSEEGRRVDIETSAF